MDSPLHIKAQDSSSDTSSSTTSESQSASRSSPSSTSLRFPQTPRFSCFRHKSAKNSADEASSGPLSSLILINLGKRRLSPLSPGINPCEAVEMGLRVILRDAAKWIRAWKWDNHSLCSSDLPHLNWSKVDWGSIALSHPREFLSDNSQDLVQQPCTYLRNCSSTWE